MNKHTRGVALIVMGIVAFVLFVVLTFLEHTLLYARIGLALLLLGLISGEVYLLADKKTRAGAKCAAHVDEREPLPSRSAMPSSTGRCELRELNGDERILLPAYVALDVETTGLNAASDRVIEVAALRVEDGEFVERLCTLVNPGQPIPAGSTAIHHITDADVRRAPSFGRIAADLVELIGEAPIVAHNASFDAKFLAAELDRCGVHIRFAYIDTVRLAREVFPGQKDYKLDTLSRALGLADAAQQHRAEDDALRVDRLYEMCENRILAQRKPAASGAAASTTAEDIRAGMEQARAYKQSVRASEAPTPTAPASDVLLASYEALKKENDSLRKELAELKAAAKKKAPMPSMLARLTDSLDEYRAKIAEQQKEIEALRAALGSAEPASTTAAPPPAAAEIFVAASPKASRPKRPAFAGSVKAKDMRPTVDPASIDPSGPLYGKVVVFTGNFTRQHAELMQLAANAGATLWDGVTRKTNVLVCGVQDPAVVGENGLSTKQEKALRYNTEGQAKIDMIDEAQFLRLVGEA